MFPDSERFVGSMETVLLYYIYQNHVEVIKASTFLFHQSMVFSIVSIRPFRQSTLIDHHEGV